MFIVRLGLAVICLGTSAFLGYEAYWSWTLAVWSASRWSGGASLQLLGVTLPFPLGMAVLIGLGLTSLLSAGYVLFCFPARDENE